MLQDTDDPPHLYDLPLPKPENNPLPVDLPHPEENSSYRFLHNEAFAVSALSVLGTYIRLKTSDATPTSTMTYLIAQFLGSFLLGLVFAWKDRASSVLFTGVSAGLCGSLTTFSSWQVEAAQVVGFPPFLAESTGDRAYAWVFIQVVGMAVPMVGLMFGKHVGETGFTRWIRHEDESKKGNRGVFLEKPWNARETGVVWFGVATMTVLGVVLGLVYVPGLTTFSLAMSPVGALTRFYTSKALNSSTFFWGTFTVNVVGSFIFGAFLLVRASYLFSPLACDALYACQEGFCGALTTVSSFVNELHSCRHDLKKGYTFGCGSVLTTQILLILLLGIFVWAQPAGVSPFAAQTCLVAGTLVRQI